MFNQQSQHTVFSYLFVRFRTKILSQSTDNQEPVCYSTLSSKLKREVTRNIPFCLIATMLSSEHWLPSWAYFLLLTRRKPGSRRMNSGKSRTNMLRFYITLSRACLGHNFLPGQHVASSLKEIASFRSFIAKHRKNLKRNKHKNTHTLTIEREKNDYYNLNHRNKNPGDNHHSVDHCNDIKRQLNFGISNSRSN